MQQGCPEQQGFVLQLAIDPGAERLGLGALPGELRDGLDGPQQVLVHGVQVVFVVLNPVGDELKLRDQRHQQARGQHVVEGASGRGRREQDALEAPHGLRCRAKGRVHQVGELPHQTLRLGAQRRLEYHAFFEDADEQFGALQDRLRAREVQQPPVDDLDSLHRALGCRGAPPLVFVFKAELVQQHEVLVFDRIHPGVEIAQEALHRLLAGFLPVPEPLGELDLVFEVQLVGLPAAEMMQVVADVPHEIQGLPEGLVFGVGEQPQVLEIPGLAQVVFEACDPDHRMVVPQPALALLEVRFQQIRGVPVVGVAAVGVGHQLFENAAGVFADDFFAELRHQLGEQHRHAADETGVQDGGQNVQVLGGQGQALLEGAGGVADVHPDIPERVDHLPDQAFGLGRDALAEEKQQVDVGVEALLLPAIAAECDDDVGVLVDFQPGSDHALFEGLLEIVVQRAGVLLQKVGLLAPQKAVGQFRHFFLQGLGRLVVDAAHAESSFAFPKMPTDIERNYSGR